MKHSAIITLLASMVLPFAAHAANPNFVNRCAAQMTNNHVTDNKTAVKVCTCQSDEIAKITQAQRDELDAWVGSGKKLVNNKTYQNIVNRISACAAGIKSNKTRP